MTVLQDLVLVLVAAGGTTAVLVRDPLKQTFVLGHFGYGAAFALILTALIAVMALTQLALLRRNEMRL